MKTFLTFILQVVIFLVLINLLSLLIKLFIFDFGYPDEYVFIISTIYFAFFSVIQTLFETVIKNHLFKKVVTSILIIMSLFLWGEDFKSYPFHALVFCCSSIFPLLIRQIIFRKVDYLVNRSNF